MLLPHWLTVSQICRLHVCGKHARGGTRCCSQSVGHRGTLVVRGGGADAARSPTGLAQLETKRSVSIAENNMRQYAAVRALRNDAPLNATQAELLRESTRAVAFHGLELSRSLKVPVTPNE